MYSRKINFTEDEIDKISAEDLDSFNITIIDHDGELLMYTIENAAEEACCQKLSEIVAYMKQEYKQVEVTVIYNNKLHLLELWRG